MSTLKPESDINPMLSRRRLLQTGAVFATVPFMQGIARAAGAGAVNVQQYHQTDWSGGADFYRPERSGGNAQPDPG